MNPDIVFDSWQSVLFYLGVPAVVVGAIIGVAVGEAVYRMRKR